MRIPKTRTVLFASHFHGFALLSECVSGALARQLNVVGVVSDDPTNPICNPQRPIWKETKQEYVKTMVVNLAAHHEIPTYVGGVEEKAFYLQCSLDWKPELCLIAVFGQNVPRPIRSLCTLGAYNFHPYCDKEEWPSFGGSDAMQQLIDQECPWLNIIMHVATEKFDRGPKVGSSRPVFIPPGASMMDLQELSATAVAELAAREVPAIIRGGRLALEQPWLE